MDPLKALHEWKKGGRGETMMSTFEYKSSHDKMFIEGFREAEAYFEEETEKLKKSYQDLFVQFNQLLGRHEWHDLEIDPKDLPEKAGWYWCKYETGYYGKAAYTGWAGDFRDVVAWRSLPEYEGIKDAESNTSENPS